MKTKYDVVVIGGGPGGIGASISAAKAGASVLLVERYGFLGGMGTAGLVNPFMPYMLSNGEILTSSSFNDIIDSLDEEASLMDNRITFDDEIYKLLLDKIMIKNGVSLLFHAMFFSLEKKENRIIKARFVYKTEVIEIESKTFIDATGDADVAFKAGFPTVYGREEDGLCQPMTQCFRLSGVDENASFNDVASNLNKLYAEAKKNKEIDCQRENVLVFNTPHKGVYHFNTTRVIKKSALSAEEMTEAEIESRRQIGELVRLFKSRSPYCKDAYLSKTATQIGVRESRRIEGEYTLSTDDVVSCRKFEDGIARTNYMIDVHNPAGGGTLHKRLPENDYYEIPYRCIIPKGSENLFVAARSISASHEAHSSLRIMPIVTTIGDAAGRAAALCATEEIKSTEIDGSLIKREMFG